MATVCHPDSGRLTATFGPVAAFYQVGVDICPARRGNRKGVVEKANHTAGSVGGAPWPTRCPGLGPYCPGPVLRAGRRRPPAAPGGWDRDHGGRAGRRRGAAPDADRAVPGRPVRRRPDQRAGPGLLPRQLLLRRPGDGRDHGHRGAPVGHCHPRHRLGGRGGAGPAPPPTRLGRRGDPPRRARHRARARGAGRVHRPGPGPGQARRPPSEAARAEAAASSGPPPAAAGGVAAAGSRSVARSSSTSPVTSRRPRTARSRAPPPPTGPGDDRARR